MSKKQEKINSRVRPAAAAVVKFGLSPLFYPLCATNPESGSPVSVPRQSAGSFACVRKLVDCSRPEKKSFSFPPLFRPSVRTCVCECVYVCAFVRSCDDDGGAGSVNPCEPPVSELLPKLAPSVVFTGASSKRGVGAGTKTKDFLNF